MKALTIMLLRISTGLLLVVWGVYKLITPDKAISISNRYYSGMISAESIQMWLGLAEVVLGLMVCLGLLRRFTYPLQSIVLFFGAALIWQHLLDPLGLWLVEPENRKILFFPSLCVFFATLVPLVFKGDDRLALDHKFGLKL
ncbi:DoxX family membrane protein [bacterium SCSIO 12696]|nr:DoxX family membrane protein [bacterium SCSIO 12696]